ncbi:hypothetical protein BGX29_010564, partial [Mortierella sp. GBA35]
LTRTTSDCSSGDPSRVLTNSRTRSYISLLNLLNRLRTVPRASSTAISTWLRLTCYGASSVIGSRTPTNTRRTARPRASSY